MFQCRLYEASEVVGDLCHQLCTSHEVVPHRCLGSSLGKQVASAKWQDDNIVLKSTKRFFQDFRLLVSFDNETPSDETFYMYLHDAVASSLGITITETGEELVARMWSSNDIEDFVRRLKLPGDRASAINTIWSLTQQNEYNLLQYFRTNEHLPRVLGTCGHVHAVESAPPGLLDPSLFTTTTWRERVHLVIGILDLVSSFEKDFKEPLHMCDIKGNNFGIGNDGRVKVIDVDTVFFLGDLLNQFTGNCTRHEDCDFFDCQALSDVETHHCKKKVLNNNLQVSFVLTFFFTLVQLLQGGRCLTI